MGLAFQHLLARGGGTCSISCSRRTYEAISICLVCSVCVCVYPLEFVSTTAQAYGHN